MLTDELTEHTAQEGTGGDEAPAVPLEHETAGALFSSADSSDSLSDLSPPDSCASKIITTGGVEASGSFTPGVCIHKPHDARMPGATRCAVPTGYRTAEENAAYQAVVNEERNDRVAAAARECVISC